MTGYERHTAWLYTSTRRLLPVALLLPLGFGGLYLLGQRLGLYSTALGLALFAVATMGVLVGLIYWNAHLLNHLAARREMISAALLKSEQRFRLLVEAAPYGLLLVDQAGRIVLANQQAELLFGYPPGHLQGQAVDILVPERFRPGHPTHRQAFVAHPQLRLMGVGRDLFGLRQDGSEFPIEIGLRPLEAEEGRLTLASIIDISERKRQENEIRLLTATLEQRVAERTAALRTNEVKLRALFDVLPVGVCILDPQRRVVEANPALRRIMQLSQDELTQAGYTHRPYIHPDGTPMLATELASVRAWEEQRPILNVEMGVITASGETIWTSVSAAPLPVADFGVVVVTVDINDRKRGEAALAHERDLLQALMDSIPDTIYFKDSASRFTRINRAQAQVLGVAEPADALGKSDRDFQPSDLAQSFYAEEQALMQSGKPLVNRIEFNPLADGQPRWFSATKVPLHDRSGRVIGLVGISRDITAYKQVEEQLRQMALHDALTGLPNRTLLLDRLTSAFEQARRHPERRFALLYLDLDRFKVINDSLGHLLGDQVLIMAARRLASGLRSADTIARLGGDEFAILLCDIADSRAVLHVVERIQQALAAPMPVGGHEVFTGTSIGIALSTPEYQQPDEILRDADAALYRAKAQGRGRSAVFGRDWHEQATRLLRLETDLHRAVERAEFRLQYQPIMALASGRLSGFEALLRWQHPERGLLSPAEFLPLAEETGLMIGIGQWMLQHACQQARTWQALAAADAPLTMAVNLSHKQFFQPDLTRQVARVLGATGLSAQHLCLEITENVIAVQETAVPILASLDELGVQLHIDDFGTGYSSLSMLHYVPLDALKIDRTFVHLLNETATKKSMIVNTVLRLAHELGLAVVAEGIETAEQAAYLMALGCEYGQGYWYAAPLDAAAATALLQQPLG